MTVHVPLLTAEFAGIRHEFSNSNLSLRLASEGDHRLLHQIRHFPDYSHMLAEEGVERMRQVRTWFSRSGLFPYDVYLVSQYTRAQQTAHLLRIPGATWKEDPRLNEREWGRAGRFSSSERDQQYPGWKEAKEARPFDWLPSDDAETLREHQGHAAELIREINARYAGKRVCFVSHGEKIQVIQAVAEGLSQEHFARRERQLRVGNGCMVRYVLREGRLYKHVLDPHATTQADLFPVSALVA